MTDVKSPKKQPDFRTDPYTGGHTGIIDQIFFITGPGDTKY
jgi:hypothetical protein